MSYHISIGITSKGKYKAYTFPPTNVTRRFFDTIRCSLGPGYWLLDANWLLVSCD